MSAAPSSHAAYLTDAYTCPNRMPQVPGVTTYLHGALIGMEVRINTSAWPGYTEAITANEKTL